MHIEPCSRSARACDLNCQDKDVRAATRNLIERWYQEVWAEGREQSIRDLMHPQAEILGIGTVPLFGPDEFLPFWRLVRRNYSDLRMDIDRLLLDGEQGLALITTHGTRVANGEAIEMRGAVYFRVVAGLLVFGRNVLDYLAILGQSGVLDLDIHQAIFPISPPGTPQDPHP